MWTLYEKCESEYIDIGASKSGDQCKTIAKRAHRVRGGEFLIRDPSGRDWMKTVDSHSWRMKWVWC